MSDLQIFMSISTSIGHTIQILIILKYLLFIPQNVSLHNCLYCIITVIPLQRNHRQLLVPLILMEPER